MTSIVLVGEWCLEMPESDMMACARTHGVVGWDLERDVVFAVEEVQFADGCCRVGGVKQECETFSKAVFQRVLVGFVPAGFFHGFSQMVFVFCDDRDVDWVGRPAVAVGGIEWNVIMFDQKVIEPEERRDKHICHEAVNE